MDDRNGYGGQVCNFGLQHFLLNNAFKNMEIEAGTLAGDIYNALSERGIKANKVVYKTNGDWKITVVKKGGFFKGILNISYFIECNKIELIVKITEQISLYCINAVQTCVHDSMRVYVSCDHTPCTFREDLCY